MTNVIRLDKGKRDWGIKFFLERGALHWGVYAFHAEGLCRNDPDSFRVWLYPLPNLGLFFWFQWVARRRR